MVRKLKKKKVTGAQIKKDMVKSVEDLKNEMDNSSIKILRNKMNILLQYKGELIGVKKNFVVKEEIETFEDLKNRFKDKLDIMDIESKLELTDKIVAIDEKLLNMFDNPSIINIFKQFNYEEIDLNKLIEEKADHISKVISIATNIQYNRLVSQNMISVGGMEVTHENIANKISDDSSSRIRKFAAKSIASFIKKHLPEESKLSIEDIWGYVMQNPSLKTIKLINLNYKIFNKICELVYNDIIKLIDLETFQIKLINNDEYNRDLYGEAKKDIIDKLSGELFLENKAELEVEFDKVLKGIKDLENDKLQDSITKGISNYLSHALMYCDLQLHTFSSTLFNDIMVDKYMDELDEIVNFIKTVVSVKEKLPAEEEVKLINEDDIEVEVDDEEASYDEDDLIVDEPQE